MPSISLTGSRFNIIKLKCSSFGLRASVMPEKEIHYLKKKKKGSENKKNNNINKRVFPRLH